MIHAKFITQYLGHSRFLIKVVIAVVLTHLLSPLMLLLLFDLSLLKSGPQHREGSSDNLMNNFVQTGCLIPH